MVSSTSSNDEDNPGGHKKAAAVTPHTNLQKPRPEKPGPVVSPAEKRERRRKILIKRAKSQRMKVKKLE